MQYKNKLNVILALLSITLGASSSFGQQTTLAIPIENIKKNGGKVVVEIYTDKASWLKTPFKKLLLSADESSKTASFDVPFGKYSISIYQDANGNGELDMNFLSIPKELIGFGNNYKPFGGPKFSSALIDHSTASKPQAIKLYSVF